MSASYRNSLKTGEWWYRYETRSWYRITDGGRGSIWVDDAEVPQHIRAAPLIEAASLSPRKRIS